MLYDHKYVEQWNVAVTAMQKSQSLEGGRVAMLLYASSNSRSRGTICKTHCNNHRPEHRENDHEREQQQPA